MKQVQASQEELFWASLKERIKAELEQKRRELQETTLMLNQSQIEVKNLTQRNAAITAHLQQVQGQFDALPKSDIRMAYESAMEAAQRLFFARGRMEKLQSDQAHLSEYVNMMEAISNALEGGSPTQLSRQGNGSAAQVVEMLIQAQEGERQRLSRQMHDGPAQALSNFILQTEIAMRLFGQDQGKARDELENLKLSAMTTFQKVRDFIFELRPMMLDDLGLVPTLKRYVDIIKDESKTETRLVVTGRERRLEPYQEVMIFRAIQELLYNTSRHSQAATAKLQLDMGENVIKVSLDDDGRGFDTEKLDQSHGMGLKVIQDRIEMVGGSIDISSAPGQGTRIMFELPVAERKSVS